LRPEGIRLDYRVVTTVVVSTLLLVLEHYHFICPYKSLDRVLFYLGVPLFVIVVVFRESPASYGFQFGDWKAGAILTASGCGVAAVVALVTARGGAMQRYYAPQINTALPLVLDNALDLIGWEFLFRGFLLFALYPVCGPYAILLQAVPFTLAHFGKPEVETLSCIFGGSAFGYVAWRTRSFVYPYLIHWFLATFTILLAAGRI
jgi:membrane protease YdiL (CAAX protease family)